MNNTQFYHSFGFRIIALKHYRHTDNSGGIPCHFLARMRCGKGRIVTAGKRELELLPGDVFYLPEGLCYHSYWYGDPMREDRVEWESYSFSLLPLDGNVAFPPQVLKKDGEVTALLDRLSQSPAVTPASVGLLYAALGRVLPYMEMRACREDSLRERASAYMEAHPNFKVAELAKHCNMSESGLYAAFKRQLDTTPLGLRNGMKMERAVALLEETDLSVEEIAARLGFGSAAYFRKTFKAVTGKTPTAVRKAAHLI